MGRGGKEKENVPPQPVRFVVMVFKAGRIVVMQCCSGDDEVGVECRKIRRECCLS